MKLPANDRSNPVELLDPRQRFGFCERICLPLMPILRSHKHCDLSNIHFMDECLGGVGTGAIHRISDLE